MATIVDSLVVELGLDPRNFEEGRKKAVAGLIQTRVEAEISAKRMEAALGQVNNFFSTLHTRALGLFSLFVGGKGLEAFIHSTVESDAALGRLSRRLGTSAQNLSAWGKAAEASGGSIDGMYSSIGGLIGEFQKFGLTGESSIIPLLRALNINVTDLVDKDGNLNNFRELLLRIADAFQKMPGPRANELGKMLGFDEGAINLLMKGRQAVADLVAVKERDVAVTQKQTAEAEKLLQIWRDLEQWAETLGRGMLYKITGKITELAHVFDEGHAAPWMGQAAGTASDWWNRFREWGRARTVDENGRVVGAKGLSGSDFNSRFSGEPSAANPSVGSPDSLLRVKPGAGDMSLGTAALAMSLQQDVSGLNRFTSFNDYYHSGTDSKHAQGLAADFTLKDERQAELVAEQIRKKLADMGIDATVLDEYNHPSRHATAGHIHVQFNSQAAADKYARLHPMGSHTVSTVHVNTLNVNTQAKDAEGIGKDIRGAIDRNSFVTHASGGLQ